MRVVRGPVAQSVEIPYPGKDLCGSEFIHDEDGDDTLAVLTRTGTIARLARLNLRRRLRGVPQFQKLSEPEILGSADRIACRPALFDPEQLDRVIACGFNQELAGELAKLEATSFVEGPLERYELGESVIAGGRILTRHAVHFFSGRSPYRALGQPLQSYDAATLANTQQGLRYFGHWLQDDCAAYEALPAEAKVISMMRPDWPDRVVYESLFAQRWSEVSFARVRALTVYRELGFSRDKARRFHALRARVRRAMSPVSTGRIVYIGRGASGGHRAMSNAAELEAAFVNAGIDVLEPEDGSEGFVRSLLDADLIIAVEGSQACHAIYTLADRGALLILQPPERFYNPHHEWTRLLGMAYGFVVGEKDATSYRINPDEVLAMSERLLAAPRDVDI